MMVGNIISETEKGSGEVLDGCAIYGGVIVL